MRKSAKPNSALQRCMEAVSSLTSCGSEVEWVEEEELDKEFKI